MCQLFIMRTPPLHECRPVLCVRRIDPAWKEKVSISHKQLLRSKTPDSVRKGFIIPYCVCIKIENQHIPEDTLAVSAVTLSWFKTVPKRSSSVVVACSCPKPQAEKSNSSRHVRTYVANTYLYEAFLSFGMLVV